MAKKLETFIVEQVKVEEVSDEIKLQWNSEQHVSVATCEMVPKTDHSDIRLNTTLINGKWTGTSESNRMDRYEGDSRYNSNHLNSSSNDLSAIVIQPAVITHINSIGKFYIQIPNFDINQNELNEHAKAMSIASTVEMNMLYLFQKSNDTNWYRGKLCSIQNQNEYLVILIDSGSKVVVNKSK